MKKLLYTLLFVGMIFSHVTAQETTGIKFFEGTWQQALEKAQKENKLIFVDCYTTWCAPCKRLASTVFTQKGMGDFYNAHFINLSLDVEKGDGDRIYKKRDLQYVPTLIIFNPRGYAIKQILGAEKTADELIKWAKEGLANADSITPDERFDKGERSDKFINEYCKIFVKEERENRVDSVLSKIVSEKSYNILYKQPYYELMSFISKDSPIALYFATNRAKFAKIYGEDEVGSIISDMYTSYLMLIKAMIGPGPFHKFNEEAYRDYLKMMTDRKLPDLKFLTAEINFYAACHKKQYEQAYNIGNKALENGQTWQYYKMAEMATHYLRESYRIKAAKWAEKAISMTKSESIKEACKKAQALLSK